MTQMTRNDRFRNKSAKEAFTEIYNINDWGNRESVSGSGSTKVNASLITERLPQAFESLKIKRLYDAACGDFNWMKDVVKHLEYYRGADVVDMLIQDNISKYETDKIKFKVCNMVIDNIENENFDAILLRDVLVHFPTVHVIDVLNKLKKCGIKYLIATDFSKIAQNIDIESFGLWRPINLEIEPFNLGEPIYRIREENQKYMWHSIWKEDKELNIWKL